MLYIYCIFNNFLWLLELSLELHLTNLTHLPTVVTHSRSTLHSACVGRGEGKTQNGSGYSNLGGTSLIAFNAAYHAISKFQPHTLLSQETITITHRGEEVGVQFRAIRCSLRAENLCIYVSICSVKMRVNVVKRCHRYHLFFPTYVERHCGCNLISFNVKCEQTHAHTLAACLDLRWSEMDMLLACLNPLSTSISKCNGPSRAESESIM